jgi:hypothetical protein
MRGEIIYKILDHLEDISMDAVDFFSAFVGAGYGATFGKIDREYRIRNNRSHIYQIAREKRRNLQKYISKLESQGLLLKNSHNKIYLSIKGKKKLSLLRKNKVPNREAYKKQPNDKFLIISYDIPIAFNKERNILRSLLTLLGFQMVHKSFWIGKVLLPSRFITDLEKLRILKFIEIMEVTKTGTLKSV